MIEYETIGLVGLVVGLVSFQIKMVDSRLKEEIENAKNIHKDLCNKLTDHLNKCKCAVI